MYFLIFFFHMYKNAFWNWADSIVESSVVHWVEFKTILKKDYVTEEEQVVYKEGDEFEGALAESYNTIYFDIYNIITQIYSITQNFELLIFEKMWTLAIATSGTICHTMNVVLE